MVNQLVGKAEAMIRAGPFAAENIQLRVQRLKVVYEDWNRLPSAVKQCKSVECFKKELKELLEIIPAQAVGMRNGTGQEPPHRILHGFDGTSTSNK